MTYDASWDRPHLPGDSVHWQESDCYWFYDQNTGVGGFHRIGHRPKLGTGQLTLFVFAKDGQRYVINDSYINDRQIGAEDRWQTGHRIGSHSAESLGDKKMRYRWDNRDSHADLEFYESFYPPRDWSRHGRTEKFKEMVNSGGHLECSGRLRGQIRIGENQYTIDALAHRDRSWGVRDLYASVSMHRFRMITGTVGPELSFASFFLDLRSGPPMIAGYVCRNGIEEDLTDLRAITTFDRDGLSPMGATILITLQSGEVVKVTSKSVQGFMTPLGEIETEGDISSDTISTFEYAGKIGFLDLEVCTNPGRGTYIATESDVTLLARAQGLSRCLSYEY